MSNHADRNITIEECAAVMDAEAQRWIDGKSKLMPLDPDNEVIGNAHDRYFNYIENAKRCAGLIRDLKK